MSEAERYDWDELLRALESRAAGADEAAREHGKEAAAGAGMERALMDRAATLRAEAGRLREWLEGVKL